LLVQKVLISAGEASGDMYAARLVEALRARFPGADFFGCAGPRMRAAGVRAEVESESLAVVGVVEVLEHIPRIYGEYRKLIAAAERERPQLAILTDSPDFHLRVAGRLKRLGVPVVYLIAPQVWAWRKGRIPKMRRVIDRLLCIFPFEQEFFDHYRIPATYIGHPLSRYIRASSAKEDFLMRHGIPPDRPLIALLPGSRAGEAARHLPALLEAVEAISRAQPAAFALGTPAPGFLNSPALTLFRERIFRSPIKVIEGDTWDLLAHAGLALAASGTVTVEAALLGTPMVTYYRVTGVSWLLGRFLVQAPYYSMVNLVAGRAVVPELMQNEMSGKRLAAEALALLNDRAKREEMRRGLLEVASALSGIEDPMDRAADAIERLLRARRH
jgi:lipid-A-disaccharide synthase